MPRLRATSATIERIRLKGNMSYNQFKCTTRFDHGRKMLAEMGFNFISYVFAIIVVYLPITEGIVWSPVSLVLGYKY